MEGNFLTCFERRQTPMFIDYLPIACKRGGFPSGHHVLPINRKHPYGMNAYTLPQIAHYRCSPVAERTGTSSMRQ
jgi:hypothetical protein